MSESKTNAPREHSDSKSLLSQNDSFLSSPSQYNYNVAASAAANDENYLARHDSDNYLVSDSNAYEPQYHPVVHDESQQGSKQRSDPTSTSINQGLASTPFHDEEAEQLFRGYEEEEEEGDLHNDTIPHQNNRLGRKRGIIFKVSIATLVVAVIVLTIALSVYFAKSSKTKSGITPTNDPVVVPTLSPMALGYQSESATNTTVNASPSSLPSSAPDYSETSDSPEMLQDIVPSPIPDGFLGDDSPSGFIGPNNISLLPPTLSIVVTPSPSSIITSPLIQTISNSTMPVASASKAPWNNIVTQSPSKLIITQLPESTSVPISGTIPYPSEFSTVFPQSSSPSPLAITINPITSESSGSPTIMTTTKRPHPTIHDVVLNAINQDISTGLNVDLLDEDSAQKAIQWVIAMEAASMVTSTDTMNADLMVAMFALAYFYYETSVEKSLDTSRWLQSADICSWEGITCKFYEANDFAASMTTRDQLRINQTIDNTAGLSYTATTTTTTTVSELNLSGRNLTGQLPSFLALLKDLEVLDLSKNSFTGEIPTSIWSLTYLRELSLWKNNFTGTISPLVSGLSKLEELHLDSNNLSGTIPTELFSLPNLTMFSAYSNKLKGSIPSEIGKLDKLETLWLSSNELSFSIPTEVGALQSLHNLYLDDNYLIGSIPGSIIKCSELADVRLNANFLSGSVSSLIGNLTNLRILYLDGNNLSGRIPTSLGQAINLGKSYRRDCNPSSGSRLT